MELFRSMWCNGSLFFHSFDLMMNDFVINSGSNPNMDSFYFFFLFFPFLFLSSAFFF
jgi:hypothetical protein